MLEHKYPKVCSRRVCTIIITYYVRNRVPVLPVDEIIVKKAFITFGELVNNGTGKISSKHNEKNFTNNCYITLYFIQSC